MLVLFAVAMFVAATLLFLVQPMFASMVLPLLGGSPSVWNTTAMFFQVALLAGYGYSHFMRTRLSQRAQVIVHGIVVLLPLLVLPIGLRAGWVPPTNDNPIPWLLLTLTLFVGLPYFAIATTSPLAQAWFSRTGHPSAKDPYFLYAASNVGSLIGLLVYPFVLQPALQLQQISQLWSLVYLVFLVLIGTCAVVAFRSKEGVPAQPNAANPVNATNTSEINAAPEHISNMRRIRWVLLAFVPSSLMLSVTTYISTDIAAIPLLWVVPLAIYLLTFIVAFSKRQFVSKDMLSMVMKALIAPMALLTLLQVREPLALMLPVHLIVFFIIALTCHTLLMHDRPSIKRLTEFYLWLSVGGALGGVFNALIAPIVFTHVMEYPLVLAFALIAIWQPKPGNRPSMKDFALPALVAVPVIVMLAIGPTLFSTFTNRRDFIVLTALAIGVLGSVVFITRTFRYAVVLGTIIVAGTFLYTSQDSEVTTLRSFFGVSSVTYNDTKAYRQLMHGTTVHGMQSIDPARACEPLSYYTRTGPIGQAMQAQANRLPTRTVGMMGLGAGTLASYARPNDSFTYYEIDPVVEQLARDPRYFTFLSKCAPQTKIIMGDGRLSLVQTPDATFDMLVLDAYSSDALPMHLLTREAVALYAHKLKPSGVLAFHISNRYFDLQPVLGNIAHNLGMVAITQFDYKITEAERALGKTPAMWVLIGHDAASVNALNTEARWAPLQPRPDKPIWTDSYASILTALK